MRTLQQQNQPDRSPDTVRVPGGDAPCPAARRPSIPGAGVASRDVSRASPLYTDEQRRRRDRTVWTTVQGVLAPLQFLVFLVSLVLVMRFLATGEGYAAATISIVVKTAVLYLIMVTGAIWEKVVFGQYLFAPAFFWEDVVSMLVMVLHTAYLLALAGDWMPPVALMLLALAAYLSYVINAAQFLLKLRTARLQGAACRGGVPDPTVAAAAGAPTEAGCWSAASPSLDPAALDPAALDPAMEKTA